MNAHTLKKKPNLFNSFPFPLCIGVGKSNICKTRRHEQMCKFGGNDEDP
jgi:hypothetical protein